jgi:hypothetical protein
MDGPAVTDLDAGIETPDDGVMSDSEVRNELDP